jgi:xylulokinase
MEDGKVAAAALSPKEEMPIDAPRAGWAEQDPEMWWRNLVAATAEVLATAGVGADEVKAIGISYQMHGLVLVDRDRKVLRPAIIWCDSRAVPYGEAAFDKIGRERALAHLLNSPGNFTAAKLAWVKQNEPEVYARVDKFLLPGDYIAMRLTGEAVTTVEGLSEGVFWDFKRGGLSDDVMEAFGFERSAVPELRPVFGPQGELTAEAAALLGLRKGTPVTYRAGDQPINALSLGVFNPGEIAATAGTSGVVYGVSGSVAYDPESRVNTFAHVNYSPEQVRLGVLLCINGTGILNSWLRRNVAPELSYARMNDEAATSPMGARGVSVVPFGNGAERVLGNREPGCSVHGVNFNVHSRADLLRAAQEGIVNSFRYGIDVMRGVGITSRVIRAGRANMFLSPLFRQSLATVTGTAIELYDTDGAAGAARGAGLGAGLYRSPAEAFASLEKVATVEPDTAAKEASEEAYMRWKSYL